MIELRDRVQEVLGSSYRIERELGAGGMSRVFVAFETALERRVVVKVLPPQLALAIARERFRREIQLAASLQHPHIVPLLAAGGSGDVFYYTMPYVEGESLRSRLAREGRLSIRDAIRTLRDVADALAYAHERGIVHRDIKPDNILLSGGHAVVADFGVAKALSYAGGESALTSLGLAIGTPAYMAPEQAAGDPNVDARADLYALGATAYEMLTGRPPFPDLAPHRMIAAHVLDPVTPVIDQRPDVPAELAELVMRCLDKAADQRPTSAAAVRDALDSISSGSGAAARSAARKSRSWIGASVAVGVLTVLALGWVALRHEPPAPLDQNRVAVAPFDVVGPTGFGLWHEGLVDVLSRGLDGAGPLRTVSPTLVIRRWHGRSDQSSAEALGRETGAQTVIYGSLLSAGPDSVRVTATIFDVSRGVSLAELELRDRADRMDRVADSLVVHVLREMDRTRAIGLVRGAPLGSRSLSALKAFLVGEQYLRRSQWDSTIEYDQRALALDSGFALAWSHAGLAAGWAHSAVDTLSITYLLRAGALNRGLAPRESLIVQAESLQATLFGFSEQLGPLRWSYSRRLIAMLTEAVRRYPTDPELWYMLGDASFHQGLLAGVGREQTLAAFDRSIALDSAFTPSYVHSIELGMELRGVEASRRYATGYLRAGAAGSYADAVGLMLLLLNPRTARDPATLALLDTMPMVATHLATLAVIESLDSSETGVWVAQRHRDRILREARTADDSAQADWALYPALALRGHLEDARRHLAPKNSLNAELALLGSIPPDTANAIMRRWISWKDVRGARPWWALPWWASRRDTAMIAATARMANQGLRAPPFPLSPTQREIVGYVTHSSQAYMALARGDSGEALRRFEALPDSACFGQCELDALTRIKLLVAFGQYDDAARRLATPPVIDWSKWATTPTHVLWEMERARVAERLHDRETARAGYGYVAAAWLHADSTLAPYVREARAGLLRLETDTKS
ncbi:MAG TPA: serine/threonine-protein kinase [Gemmatimonadales bacterium]|nr:serine/threonine-protein kinase [Gemmatimonadales bacterium]